MHLWTWQNAGHSLTSGTLDYTKSQYYETVPGITVAYDELVRRLRLSKYEIIWCTVRRDPIKPNKDAVEWMLSVPRESILAFTDAFMWNKIIGLKTYPMSLRDKWTLEAPEDEDECTAYIDQQVAAYHFQPEPSGGWWSQLFIKDLQVEAACALLRHPIPESWIVHG